MRSKKALYNVVSNLILQVFRIVSGFIVPRIILGTFGSNINGLVSSITQFLGYITLLESGFGPVIKSILYKPLAKKDKRTVGNILKVSEIFFRRIAYVFLVYIAILCVVYPTIINSNYDWIFTASLVAIISISAFAEYFFGMTYSLFLQAKQKNYVISLVQIVTYVLSTASVIILAKTGASIQIIKLASGLIFVIKPLFLNSYVKRKYHINLKEYDGKYKLEKKWDGLAQHIAYVIHTKTDVTVLTIFTTLAEVSVYSVYFLVVKATKSFIEAFSNGIDAAFGDMIAKDEKEKLNKRFSSYEVLYFMVNTIVFATVIVIITPFVSVYTKGITDADYYRPVFGALLVISEYIWAMRQPYYIVSYAAGHFKETRRGAWVECLSNIIISVILVNWLGIIGVAIGTIVAMAIRTAEFVYHANKYILQRSIWSSIKKLLLVIVETITIVIICNYLPHLESTNYLSWIINSIIVFVVSVLSVLLFNLLFFREEFKNNAIIIKRLVRRKK